MARASVPVWVGITQRANKVAILCIDILRYNFATSELQSTAGPPAPLGLGARNRIRKWLAGDFQHRKSVFICAASRTRKNVCILSPLCQPEVLGQAKLEK